MRRRWVRVSAWVLGILLLLVAAVWAWAFASVQRSTTARAMVWMEADVGDRLRFPSRPIPAGDETSPLPTGEEIDLDEVTTESADGGSFDRSLRANHTLAFVVVHRDRLVYERYFDGSHRDTLQTSFSVAKSILSTAIGIALDEGRIGSIDDPVTDYVPELLARDRRFARITLRDLLSMSSGLRYDEPAVPVPWGDAVTTYYGVDLRRAALEDTAIEEPPGTEFHYNNYNPLLLGLVLERATGTSVSDFMATKLWQPLGAEADATWSLDSERSGFEKMESGINATAVDYARFGLLFLHDGKWNGRRIVSKAWVRAATRAGPAIGPAYYYGYRYFWWTDVERPGRFYAFGKYGQYVYVAPDVDAVVVRLGRDWGVGNVTWLATLREVADQLGRRE
jgi:CubicO group peptidase (beta-lactamase class C family)